MSIAKPTQSRAVFLVVCMFEGFCEQKKILTIYALCCGRQQHNCGCHTHRSYVNNNHNEYPSAQITEPWVLGWWVKCLRETMGKHSEIKQEMLKNKTQIMFFSQPSLQTFKNWNHKINVYLWPTALNGMGLPKGHKCQMNPNAERGLV